MVNRNKPGSTPELRENQLISAAMNLAEKQLLEGTASSQVITHFLKLGTSRAELERERLEHENRLLESKTAAIQQSADNEQLYNEVLSALKKYSGIDEEDYDEYEEL